MCLKIWYMPLKPAIDIHMRDVSFCQATNWVDTTYLHLHTYFHYPPKNGFELSIHDMSNRWSPKH